MSFTCQIWEYPSPDDFAEAQRLIEALSATRVQNPRFLEFARELTEIHPCITTIPEDEVEEKGVWTDGPLDGEAGSLLYSIGILSQHIENVFPFVVERANALGLHVYEDINGRTYRPDGSINAPERGDGEPRLAKSGVDLTQLGRMLVMRLRPAAEAFGFREIAGRLVRPNPDGWQELRAAIMQVGSGELIAVLNLDTRRHDVTRQLHSLDPKGFAGKTNGIAFSLSAYEFLKAPLFLRDPSDFRTIANTFAEVARRDLLPLADECATLAGLDRVMNTGRTRLRYLPFNHMVVSRLADTGLYDVVYETLLEQGHIPDDRKDWYSGKREVLAIVVPSRHETVFHSAVGPKGAQAWVTGPDEK